MATKIVKVDATSTHSHKEMRYAVRYLNAILKTCPEDLTRLLDRNKESREYYGDLPCDVVVRELQDSSCVLTSFGVLAGLSNVDPFRLGMEWDSDEAATPIDRFIILEVQ
jgi:hypothetical protein